jgi:hypothetical protein
VREPSPTGAPGPFTDVQARRFQNAEDYFELLFSIASDFTPATTFEGAFFVEAKDGTRLWVNATEGGPSFFVDSNMVTNLARLRPAGFFATTGNGDPPTSIVAVDEFPYLNPRGCR